MKNYLGFLLVCIGVVLLVAAWLTGLSRLGNIFLLFPFLFILAGIVVYVLLQKRSSKY